jgi:PAS domain S-box-containing protein
VRLVVDITKIDNFVHSSPHPGWLATSNGDCIYANPALERLTGLNSDQIKQADWRSFLLEEDRVAATASWQSSLATGTPYRTRVRMRGFDGVPSAVELIAFGQKVSDGTEVWLFTALCLHSATQQHTSLEAQLQSTLNLIPAYTWYALPSGALTFVNERTADYLGLPKDQPLRFGIDMGAAWDSHLHFVHLDDHEEARKVWSTCLRTGRAGDFTFRIRDAKGEYRWFLGRAEPLRASDGTLLYWIGVNFEIDEAKRAEQALQLMSRDLQESKTRLEEVQRIAHVGHWVWDLGTNRVIFSDEAYRIWGLRPQERPMNVEAFQEMIHPEDREFLLRARQEARGGGPPDLEFRIVRPSGEVRIVHSQSAVTRDVSGQPRQRFGTVQDITDRKRAEETLQLLTQELRTREAYLAEAQRLSHTGSFGWRPDSGEIVWSDETYRIFEYPRAVTPTMDLIVQRVHPEDRAGFQDVIDRASGGATDFEHAYRLLLPDGRVKHVHAIAQALENPSGNREFVGAGTDITERKNAEEKVRESEAELRQILDFVPWQVAVLGADGKAIYLNKAGLDYHGLTREAWQDYDPHRLIHPDDHERILTGAGGAKLLSGESFENEARLLRKDGKYRWFLFQFNPLRDGEGRLTRWYVTNADIEERKQAEERLRTENIALREEISKASMFEEIVGASPALQTVLSRVAKVAPTASTVLITGETGTGKELVARAIHRRSQRASRPFVSVNCAAIPRDLIASELFGHEKGAFTGALQRRLGKFEVAEGGTLFLDEVGELPPETQIALLRVLQEHEFERVGGNQAIQTDVRVIAATNRDLQAAIATGIFRSDLFYRLNVFPIEVPPLRSRKGDIAILVEYFIDRFARQVGKKIKSIDKKTLELVQAYPWPGNIRELQNVIERSVVLSETEVFSVDESWLSRASPSSQRESPRLSKEPVLQEKEIIEAALAETKGRVSGPAGAAAKLGIPSTTLESKIKSLKINKHHFKGS